MRLDQQLRENSAPNPWETGWLFFRYQSSGSAYYLAHKTNGMELGKLLPLAGGTSQVFLATTNDSPAELGQWYQYQVVAEGARVQVFVDGVLRIDYTDPEPIPNGRVGLYTEDAHVQFESPVVTMTN